MSEPRQFHAEPLCASPHLTQGEFEGAIKRLLFWNNRHSNKRDEWLSVDVVTQNETTYLSIAQPLMQGAASVPEENETDDEIEDDGDDEVLHHPMQSQPNVRYDVLLSPTYRVPVLYISISDARHRYPPTMAILKDHIIPHQFLAETGHVGVIGGITLTEHPATNRPVFFIHPCQTADVMEAVAGNGRLTADEYLIMWLGAFGKCVGLNVPLALARHVESTGQDVD